MVLARTAPIGTRPLIWAERPDPICGPDEVLLEVHACGVCHTELDEIEGRLPPPTLPVIPGHQVVGRIVATGPKVDRYQVGDRVGVTWLYRSCGTCGFCRSGRENLCPLAMWTGLTADGGYAERMVVGQDWAYPLPEGLSDVEAAPLLCAGVIGYRTVRLAQVRDGQAVGLFGFGASAHIVLPVLKFQYPACRVFVFTRGPSHRSLASRLGADWVGGPEDTPPEPLDVAMDFTPVGETVARALAVSAPGARLVINAIRKTTPIGPLDYAELLWHERQICSVANVTRADAEEFLPLAGRMGLRPQVTCFAPEQANEALIALKHGQIDGAAVLRFAQ